MSVKQGWGKREITQGRVRVSQGDGNTKVEGRQE